MPRINLEIWIQEKLIHWGARKIRYPPNLRSQMTWKQLKMEWIYWIRIVWQPKAVTEQTDLRPAKRQTTSSWTTNLTAFKGILKIQPRRLKSGVSLNSRHSVRLSAAWPPQPWSKATTTAFLGWARATCVRVWCLVAQCEEVETPPKLNSPTTNQTPVRCKTRRFMCANLETIGKAILTMKPTGRRKITGTRRWMRTCTRRKRSKPTLFSRTNSIFLSSSGRRKVGSAISGMSKSMKLALMKAIKTMMILCNKMHLGKSMAILIILLQH